MTGIGLGKGDKVASMEVVEADGDLLVVTTGGYGKRTPLSEYPVKGRATGGVQTFQKDALKKAGVITAARVVQEADDLTIISASGVVLRTKVKDVSRSGRATRGVRIMNVEGDNYVASVARTAAEDLRKVGAGNGKEAASPPAAENTGLSNGKP